MYVIPFSMGPIGSPIAQIGVQLTDAPMSCVNMRIMTRMGKPVLDALGDGFFVRACTRSARRSPTARRTCRGHAMRPTNTSFTSPKSHEIWSYGRGYGGNALLGKKCLALRIASVMARDEGWLAEHMLILGIQSPKGEKTYVAAAFPSACGKTNLAMLVPPKASRAGRCSPSATTSPGSSRRRTARLRAINPEAGFFGVAPGTNYRSNPNAMATIGKNTIFTNVRADRRRRYLVGGDDRGAGACSSTGKGNDWTPGCGRRRGASQLALHRRRRANARPSIRLGRIRRAFRSGLHLRRPAVARLPARFQAFNWSHGVYLGRDHGLGSHRGGHRPGGHPARSHRDAAVLRLQHGRLLEPLADVAAGVRESAADFPRQLVPQGRNGKFAWPGFGQNMRVCKWIVDRVHGRGYGVESPIGWMPRHEDIEWKGLDFPSDTFYELMSVGRAAGSAEAKAHEDQFDKFFDRLPKEFIFERELLRSRLWRSPDRWELAREDFVRAAE